MEEHLVSEMDHVDVNDRVMVKCTWDWNYKEGKSSLHIIVFDDKM